MKVEIKVADGAGGFRVVTQSMGDGWRTTLTVEAVSGRPQVTDLAVEYLEQKLRNINAALDVLTC